MLARRPAPWAECRLRHRTLRDRDLPSPQAYSSKCSRMSRPGWQPALPHQALDLLGEPVAVDLIHCPACVSPFACISAQRRNARGCPKICRA